MVALKWHLVVALSGDMASVGTDSGGIYWVAQVLVLQLVVTNRNSHFGSFEKSY